MEYLFSRGIDYEIINYCLDNDLIMESLPYHNVVFIGYDEERKPKYAAYRATINHDLWVIAPAVKSSILFVLPLRIPERFICLNVPLTYSPMQRC